METTFTHKCPNCGGPLLFNPKDQKFHCEYCLNIYTEEEVTRYEQQQHEAHLENPSTTTAEENLTFTAEEESSATQQTETTENETTADVGTMEILIVQAVALKLSPMQQRLPHTVIIAIIQLSWLVD